MDIDSVIWEVSPSALEAVASKRVTELAKPKNTPNGFQEQRLVEMVGLEYYRKLLKKKCKEISKRDKP